jgi:flagellar basal-body rod protein FlgG
VPGSEDTYLLTAQGYYVLDADGNRIRLPDGTESLGVSEDGVLSTSEGDFATLGIASFTNPNGLSDRGDGCYQATEGFR